MIPSRFDQAAATWDDNPVRQALTRAIAGAIRESVPLKRDWSALEYGCGTAALSVLLAGALGRITAADTSAGMLEEARRKLAAAGMGTITPQRLDLTCDAPPSAPFDFIFSAMTLHHVENVAALAATFAAMLAPGGWLALADLLPEDGSFHPSDQPVPHHGIDPEQLVRAVADAGLANPVWRTIHTVVRNGRNYPVFLLTARRPAAKPKVLFLCTGNSCRSQMAEGWARALKGGVMEAYSAGIEAHGLNPQAVRVMEEAGVDISGQRSKVVSELAGIHFDYVVTVCGHAAESCPRFPGPAKVIHHGFDDPPRLAQSAANEAEALTHYRLVRDEIRAFVETLPEGLYAS